MSDYSSTSAPRGYEIPQPIANLIEQQQREIENLKTQVDAGLKFSGWMREVACKVGWQPNEARSDYDAVIGYMGVLEEENRQLNAKIEKLLDVGDKFMSASNWDCSATRKSRADWYKLHPYHSKRLLEKK